MSKNIVFEGWLTKSPPTKRIWRTKWRRRWFALRQSGELPGQYFLDYYADRNCRRLKGTINLDLCEQVDAGLHMERSGGADPKLRGSVFTIQTQSRTYHLEADCEAEMEKWVDAICRVCGLRATDDSNEMDTYQNTRTVTATNEHYDRADTTGPYIPISECITGVRAQDAQRAFKSERKRVARSSRTRSPCERVADSRPRQIYSSQPQIRVDNPDPSDDSMSDDERSSMNFSLSNIGPPVPPRPPMTLTKTKRVLQRETHNGPRVQEPQELLEHNEKEVMEMIAKESPWHFVPQRKSVRGAPSSSGRKKLVPYIWTTVDYDSDDDDDDDEFPPGHLTLQYCNLPSLPPAVDRALKPRHSSHSIGHVSHYDRRGQTRVHVHRREEIRQDVLQYLDLDLHTSRPVPPESQEAPRSRMEVNHGKSLSAAEADSAYKTVDFLKTEAFNITRKDAEASRSNQQ